MMKLFFVGALVCVSACAFASTSSDLGYVDSGLIAHWDAIDNQATGSHSDSAKTWVDLVGSSVINLSDTSWEQDAAYFPGSGSSGGVLADKSVIDHRASGLTIEIVARFEDTGTYASLFAGPTYDASSRTGSAYANSPVLIRSADKSYFYTRSASECGMTPAITNELGTVSVNWTSGASAAWLSGTYIYLDGVKANKPAGARVANMTSYDGNAYIGRAASAGIAVFKGRIYSIRVYHRTLTAQEALQNYNADQARFNRLATVRAGSVTIGGTTYHAGDTIIGAAGVRALAIDSAADASIELSGLAASLSVGAGSLALVSDRRVDLDALELGDGAALTLPAGGLLVRNSAVGENATVNGPGRFIVCTNDATSPIPLADGALFFSPYQGWAGWPESGVAYLPMGTAATIPDAATAAKVAGLDGIVFLDDAGLNVGTKPSVTCSVGSDLEFAMPIEGNGTVSFLSCGDVTLSGNNSKLTGQFYFSNTACTVTHEFGLGSAKSGTCNFWHGDNKPLKFDSDDDVITNHVAVYCHPLATKHVLFGSASSTVKLVQEGEVRFGRYNTNQDALNFYFYNDVDVTGCFKYSTAGGSQYLSIIHHSSTPNGVVGFYGSFLGANGYFYWNGGKFDIGCPISNSSCNFLPAPTAYFNCRKPNVFSTLYNWHPNQNGATINLNGYDQIVRGFAYLSGNATSSTKDMLVVTSSVPAKVTLTGTETKSVQLTVRGAAGLCMAGTGAYTVYNLYGDTTGELSINSGTLTLDTGSYWNGNGVTIRGGELVLKSEDAVPTGTADLTVTGGKLTVKASAVAMFRTAVFGTGDDAVALPDGTYTIAQLRAMATVQDYIGDASDDEASITVDSTWEAPWAGWPEEGGEVRIPKNSTVTVTAGDFARIAKVTALSMGNNSRLVYAGLAGDELPFSFPVTGTGRIAFEDCTGTIVITEDNSGIAAPGGFDFTRTDVVVSNRYGLGSAQTGPCNIETTLNTHRSMVFKGPAGTNDVAINVNNNVDFRYENNSIEFLQQGDFRQIGGNTTSGRTTFGNKMAFGGVVSLTYVDLPQPVRFAAGSSLMCPTTMAWLFGAGRTIRFEAPNPDLDALTLQVNDQVDLDCDYAFALSGALYTYSGSSLFRMNGHDQLVGGLTYQNGGTWQSDNTPIEFTSEEPATLFVTNLNANQARAAKFTGAVSLDYAGNKKQQLGYALNDTTGSLTVRGGTLEMGHLSYWGGTEVKLLGGTLQIDADCATNAGGAGAFFNRKTNLVIDKTLSGDRLDIAADRTETVNSLFIIDGEHPEGYYAAAGDYTCGGGTLLVRHNSPKTGMLLLVK